MRLTLDLHLHSQASPDGRMTVEEIAAAARARGLHGVAVCDHDVVYTGPTEVDGVLLIPGVEFSTEHGHLLGLFVRQPMVYTTWEETTQAVRRLGGLTVLANAQAAAFAKDYGLIPTAGSDAHLAQEIGNGTITVEAADRTLPAIRTALLDGKGWITGEEGSSLCVARSQYTKLKKTHAPPLRYGRWAAFALKCAWEDLRRTRRKGE